MKLRVYIECPDCGRRKEVWVLGGWDIKRVLHQCHNELGRQHHDGEPMKDGDFAVEFEPQRAMA